MPPRARHRLRSTVVVLTSLALTAASLVTIDAARPERAAASVETASAQGTSTTVAPDPVAAQIDARVSGHRVEVLSDRTETTQVFINPDGTVTREIAAAPVRVKDPSAKDGWRNIDLSLVPSSDGSLHPASPLVDLTLSGGDKTDPNADLVKLDPAGPGALGLTWPGTLPAPTVDGDTATYANVAPNTDLVVTATRFGFEDSFVLKQRPANPETFVLPLSVHDDGLTVKDTSASTQSGMNLADSAGRTVAKVSPATTWDSSTVTGTGEPAKLTTSAMTIDGSASGQTLTIAPDPTFLTDPGTKYPITIDPSFTITDDSVTGDTYVRSDYPTTNYASDTELDVGTYNGGASKARSYLWFKPPTNIQGTKVTSASLQVYEFHSYSCTASEIDAYGTSAFSTVTWNSGQPTVNSATKAPVTTAKGYSSSCPAGTVSFNVTAATQAQADAGNSLFYYTLRASETDSNGWKRFYSSSTSKNPALIVNYDHYPTRPNYTAVTASPATTYKSVAYVSSTKPKLSGAFADIDGQTAKMLFQIWDGPDSNTANLITTCLSSAVAPGATASCTIGTALSDNKVYYLRAQAQSTYSSMNSAWSYLDEDPFSVAVSKPAAPTVSCLGYANGSWTAAVPGSPVSCTVVASTSGGTSAPMKLQVTVDGGTPIITTFDVGTGRSLAVSVPNRSGSHSVTASTFSATGVTQTSPTTYAFGLGSASITAPASGTTTNDTVRISAAAPPRGSSSVNAVVQWRPAGTSTWNDGGPITGSTLATGSTGSEPVTVTNFPWSSNLATASTTDLRKSMLLEVRVCFTYSGSSTPQCTTDNSTTPTTVLRVPHAFGGGFPTAAAGDGEVALWTGELALDSTDVNIPTPNGSLVISRTHSSYDQSPDAVDGVFGTGWAASFGADSDATALRVSDSTTVDGTISLSSSAGDTLVFREHSNGTVLDPSGTYAPATEITSTSGDTLNVNSTSDRLTLTSLDGSVSVWTLETVSGTALWAPLSSQTAASHSTTTYSTASGLISRIAAPVAADITCTTGTPTAGCNALDIYYTSGRVSSIDYEAYDPQTQAVTTTTVASYTYDSSGRLSTFTDRLGLTTTYHWAAYGTNTVVTEVDHTGAAPDYYDYDYTDSYLRLQDVRRGGATSSDATAVQSAFVYQIPTTTTGLPDLSAAATAAWGQTDAPATAAAVFGADHPVSSTNPTQIATADWPYAELHYADAEGYEVDTSDYGAGQWLTTAEFYVNGQLDSTLQPSDTAAEASGNQTDLDAGRTVTRYNADVTDSNGNILIPAGTYVLDQWGPVTSALVGGQQQDVRLHTHYDYDQGAPNSDTNPATGLPYNLVTTTTVSYTDPDNYSTNPDDTLAPDIATVSVTKTGYDAITGASFTGTSGWTLGQPTSTTTVMPNSADNITRETAYDTDGNTIATLEPGSGGNDAGTTLTYYYGATSATNPAACGSTPEPQWAGLPCWTGPAQQPESGSPMPSTSFQAYNLWLDPATTVETSGTGSSQAVRTTTNTYLPDGRPNETSITTVGLTGSTPVPRTKTLYDPVSKLQTGTANVDSTDTITSTVNSTLDLWGRVTSYTDATGATTTTAYMPNGSAGAGSVSDVTNPYGSTDYTYDGTDAAGNAEHRGLTTSQTVSGLGTYTGAYDQDGNLTTENMPGSLVETRAFDAANRLIDLNYSSQGSTWLDFARTYDGSGRVGGESDSTGRSTSFAYNQAARLTAVQDATTSSTDGSTSCATRNYAFDVRGNRTSLSSASGTTCPTSGLATTTWTYDNYSRQQGGANGSGAYSYDSFGRQTALPARDAADGSNNAASLSYFDSDDTRSITQAGTTTIYGPDPESRRLTENAGSSTTTNGYGDSTDSPTWSTRVEGSATTVSRYATDLTNSLAGIISTSGGSTNASLQLADTNGNVVGEAALPTSGPATGLSSFASFDEYGLPTGSPASRYAWQGESQRATVAGGLMQMGARIYNPTTGRFTSPDPLVGGNENTYNYPNDPVDTTDPTGESARVEPWGWSWAPFGLGPGWANAGHRVALGLSEGVSNAWRNLLGFETSGVRTISSWFAKTPKKPRKNSERDGHDNGKNWEKHSKAQSHGGSRHIKPNRNKRNRPQDRQ